MSFSFFFLFTTCWWFLCVNVASRPVQRHIKRNSYRQNVLRRCGNEDFDSATSLSTEYQYLPDTIAPRLSGQNLTWKITQYPAEIDNHTAVESVNLAATAALNLWSSVADLNFYHTDSGTPNIEIKFQFPKTHNRQCDGVFSSGVIGHYIAGSVNPGKIHFNEQYEWTTTRFDTQNNSINLVTVIAHEVGHLLGFGHTIVPNSIMYREYPSHVISAPIVLSADDISAVTKRYGLKVHPHSTAGVPSTTLKISSAGLITEVPYTRSTTGASFTTPEPSDASTRDTYGCSESPTKIFHEFVFAGYLEPVCSTLYELDNCRGSYLMTSKHYSYYHLNQANLGNWENRISSLVVAPNCRIKVCSVVGGNRVCSTDLTGTKSSLDSRFDNRIDRVFCWCSACPVLFPIKKPDQNVCAVAYSGMDCQHTARFVSPGVVGLRDVNTFWLFTSFGSAQVNPNCTVSFCHAEAITNHTCLTLNGGASGKSYPRLDSRFMSNVTKVHCGCLS